MSSDDLKKELQALAGRLGKSEVRRLLAIEYVSPSTVDKILEGNHGGEFRGITAAAIRRVIDSHKAS